MATEPASLPRWAETSGGTPAANITEPTTAEKDSGYTLGQVASSAKINWLLRLLYKWIEFFRATHRDPQEIGYGLGCVRLNSDWTYNQVNQRIETVELNADLDFDITPPGGGMRLVSVTVALQDTVDVGAMTVQAYHANMSDSTSTTIAGTGGVSALDGTRQEVTQTITTPVVVPAGRFVRVRVTSGGGWVPGERYVFSVRAVWDRP